MAKEILIRIWLYQASMPALRKNQPSTYRKDDYVGVYPLVTKHLLNTYYQLGS